MVRDLFKRQGRRIAFIIGFADELVHGHGFKFDEAQGGVAEGRRLLPEMGCNQIGTLPQQLHDQGLEDIFFILEEIIDAPCEDARFLDDLTDRRLFIPLLDKELLRRSQDALTDFVFIFFHKNTFLNMFNYFIFSVPVLEILVKTTASRYISINRINDLLPCRISICQRRIHPL